MSACKTTRRAPARHAKPFVPEMPLTSLVFEGGNYYNQQIFAGLNLIDDGLSFGEKVVYLFKIDSSGVNEKALMCKVHPDGVYSTAYHDSRREHSGENAKKGKRYFWNDNLLFLCADYSEPSFRGDGDFCQSIAVLFQICLCQFCKKRPGIPIKSLRPLQTELCISVSINSKDPPRFANLPLTIQPAVLSPSSDSPTYLISKTGLLSPHNLVFYAILQPNHILLDDLSLNHIIFTEMAAKLIQVCEMEVTNWPIIDKEKEVKRNVVAESIPASPPLQVSGLIVHGSDDPLFPSPPFSGISAVSTSSTLLRENLTRISQDSREREDMRFIETVKYLAGSSSAEPVPVKRPTLCLKTMLEEEVNTDWEIISTDGKSIKCHLAVLATQVPFFRSFVNAGGGDGDTLMNLTGFAMPSDTEMDEQAVKAFLRFIYIHDTEMMKASFQVCFTLLRAGHWHQLASLVKSAADIITQRGYRLNHLGWFTVNGLWRLFEFVRCWDDGYPMKLELMNSAIDVLKILLVQAGKSKGDLKKITNGDDTLADLIYGFLTR